MSITYKDRLSRVGFDLFKYLFAKYHAEIIVMSELAARKTDQQEIFEEISSLLDAFSIRMNPGRRKKIKAALADESEINAKGGKLDGEKAEVEQETYGELCPAPSEADGSPV